MYKVRSISHGARGAALVIGIVALVGCEPPKPTIHADFDRTVNFANYHTYDYENPVGTDKAGYSTLLTQYFKQSIDAEMSSRGYRKVDANPDLYVNFMANAVEKTDVRSTPSSSMTMGMGYYGYRGGMYTTMPMYSTPDVQTIRYKVGTANIDVVDAREKRLIWTGVIEGKLTDEVMKNPQPAVASVVSQMFSQFPGRTAPAN
jgi:hypothetical protein